jgi:tetratricopeptide (TPR) repeat protein
MNFRLAFLTVLISAPTAASAQMAVTTFGATDAQRCYEDARDDFSRDASACDAALRSQAMTERDRVATYVNRGVVLNRAGSLDDALGDFNRAIAENEDLAEAFLNRGNTYFLMRRYDEAIADYEAALGRDLEKAHVAWYNIGLAREAKNDAVGARDAYRTALEINPDFGPAQKKLGPKSAE